MTGIDVAVRTPPLDPAPTRQRRRHATPRPPQPPTRRQRITELMTADPSRTWRGAELAERLQVKTRNLLTQLAEWSRLGLITRTGTGTYALNTPPQNWTTRSNHLTTRHCVATACGRP